MARRWVGEWAGNWFDAWLGVGGGGGPLPSIAAQFFREVMQVNRVFEGESEVNRVVKLEDRRGQIL